MTDSYPSVCVCIPSRGTHIGCEHAAPPANPWLDVRDRLREIDRSLTVTIEAVGRLMEMLDD